MKQKHNAVDYLFSADNIMYTEWEKRFAWLPVKTLSGKTVWFRSVYTRKRMLLDDIPQLPINALNKLEHATLDEILSRRLRGLP